MTTDDTRPRPVTQIVITIAIAIGSVPMALAYPFSVGAFAVYWAAAFVAFLVASSLERDDGVDVAGAVGWWGGALAATAVPWTVMAFVLFAFVDFGFDLCDENWDGGPDEDCF